MIIDAQVHIWQAGTPERPWRSPEAHLTRPFGYEDLLAIMKPAGVGGAVLVPPGHKGSADISLAMERGEVHGQVRPWSQIKGQSAALLREAKIDLLVQYTPERHPDLPNVPTVVELAKTDEARAIFTLLVSGAAIGRALVAPPELPAGRAETLRAAFDAMLKGAALRADAEKSRLEIDPMGGEKLAALAAAVLTSSPAVIRMAAELTARPKKKAKKKAAE